jgi:flagellar motor switch protein FliM
MDAPDTTSVVPAEPAAETQAPVNSASISIEPAAAESAPGAPQRFDFRHPVFLSSAEWRKLRMEIEEFVESTGSLLSTYLRLDLTLQLGKLHTHTFGEFTSSLPSPTHITLFKNDPLRGISLLEIRSGIAQAIVDRLLGGPGKGSGADRNLTDMEVALMDQFVQMIIDEWCKMWDKLQELRGEILGHENNAKFLQCASSDTLLLGIVLNLRMGESEGEIQLALPYTPLEPLINKLAQLGAPPATQPASAAPAAQKWTQNLDKVPMTMNACWPAIKLPTRALMGLTVGSVIDLSAEDAERLEMRVGPKVKFRGRLGMRDKTWAVQITEVCKL